MLKQGFPNLSRIVETLANAAIVLAATIVAVVLVRREFSRADARPATTPPLTATALPDSAWRAIVQSDEGSSAVDGKVRIAVFADLECPYCASFHNAMRSVQRQYPHDLTITFVHFPLRQHRFAVPAARAAECARSQNRFEQFVDVIFLKQDSLGLKGWGSYADEAGVRDTTTFVRCSARPDVMGRINAGAELSQALGIESTPTVIVNGLRLSAPPSEQKLVSIVKRILHGERTSSLLERL